MTIAATLRRPATILAVLLVSLLATLMVPSTTAHAAVDSGAEQQFVAAVNQERAAQGLPALQVASDLTAVARRHSARMADGDNLHHNPNLGSEVSGWQKVGENVGTGPSVGSIHSAFMNSASHRANIVGSDWTQVGIGVEVRGSTIWVTQVFRQPAGTSAPAPEPEPEPEPKAKAKATPKPEPEPEPEPEQKAAPAPASADEAPASTTDAPQPAPEVDEPAAAQALPAVAPETDRALAMMTRVAAVDAELDAMTD